MKSIIVTGLIAALSAMNISYANNALYKKTIAYPAPQANSALYYSPDIKDYQQDFGDHTYEEMREAFANLRADAFRKQKHLAHLANKEAQRKRELAKKPDIKIGATADKVLNSRWGEPEYKTREGNEERWVYTNGEYIFLKNGRVTQIVN